MATTKQPFVPPDRPLDGVRNGINGWRMSEAEAKERTIGNEEWWKMEGIDGRTVPLKQYSRGPFGCGAMHTCIWANGKKIS